MVTFSEAVRAYVADMVGHMPKGTLDAQERELQRLERWVTGEMGADARLVDVSPYIVGRYSVHRQPPILTREKLEHIERYLEEFFHHCRVFGWMLMDQVPPCQWPGCQASGLPAIVTSFHLPHTVQVCPDHRDELRALHTEAEQLVRRRAQQAADRARRRAEAKATGGS